MTATTLWTGWDPGPGTPTTPPEEFARSRGAAGEVLFELLALAGRGFRPPRYLTVADALAHDGAPGSNAASSSPGAFRRSWSVEYRWIAQTAPMSVTPYGIYLLGVDPPRDATDAELVTFNDFYTNVHLPEVAERRNALRAERFERVRMILAPAKGAPRYLAVYEVDEAGASRRRHVGPPYSKGPDVWQRHTTPWRIWYRRITE